MVSLPPRPAESDRLLSPGNSVLTIIDYQPTQIQSIQSMDRNTLINRITVVAKIAKVYDIPVVLSTVNVATGRNKDTIPQLTEVLKGVPSYDHTSINAWEDKDYVEAIKATGRKKIIIGALWTEACLTFPTLDAIAEGFDVYPVVDAVGGTSPLAHETALRRVEQAGAHLLTIPGLLRELQRDWNREDTVPGFLDEMFESGTFVRTS